MKSNSEVSENRFLGSISASSLRNLLPISISAKHKPNSILKKTKSDAENTPPAESNVQIEDVEVAPALNKQPRPQIALSDGQNKAPAPPDPSIKEEVASGLNGQSEEPLPSDSPVKVVVRIRPGNEHEKGGERLVTKVSSDSLCVGDRKFSFDSVLDSKSNQEDIFQLVGVPLVKNALAGYNNTILSYGQSGSGKTYTMWGPPSAIVEDPSPSSHQGIVPRIFQMLFSEIQKEQDNSEGKQINYQCRCSFLEIYNEQIGDLLDPTQRNLEIKDDSKNGLYVENLTEEFVTTYEDITQILIKGLSSRKVGATSVNSKSSRSHIVFTCIIESWCKGSSSKCFSSSKTSRINLVDLAGLDTNKHDDVGRQELIEGKKVKKSLSKLGYLVDTLAKGSQSGKHEDVLYKGSCLTHLMRESLGGNSKLTVICAISPDNKCSAEMLRTLRFGQLVKSIRNEPVINEINEDDVNDLSDQIRQLKEELIRAKSNVNSSTGSKFGYFNGQNVRDSLNQLRVSLNRSLILPRLDNDSEEEVNVDMHDVRELCQQLDKMHGSCEGNSGHLSNHRDSIEYFSVDESSETDLMSEDDIHYPEETEVEEINLDVPTSEHHKNNITSMDISSPKTTETIDPPPLRRSLAIIPSHRSSILQEPTLSESPKFGNVQRRSTAISSSFLSSENNVSRSSKLNLDALRQSVRQSEIRSSLQSSKIFPGPTESLAASLQRGLQIIDYHQQNSASNRSSIAFSFEHLTLKPCPEVDSTDASVQTLPGERSSTTLLCASCQQKVSSSDCNEVQDSLKTWIVAVDEAELHKQQIDPAPKDAGREAELENICKEQAAKIEQLNLLVEQYKLGQVSTLCLEDTKNETIPSENDKLQGSNNVENHQPEIIKEIREELDHEYGNIAFDINEKEALLKEIQSLKSKLQSYTDASPNKSMEKLRSSYSLLQSINLRRSLRCQGNSEEELESERQRWTEMESDWISLTDELRVDLETIRQRAEKVEMELRLEKKCTEELDDALNRSVIGHARMIEHYADLQEKYNDLLAKHRAIMEGIAEVKRAAAKAGKKGNGPRFAKSLAAELSALRVERERERDFLKKENKSLKIQLRDTAEAVHAAGELLVRLREAEHIASIAEENFSKVQEDNEKLKKQMEKLKRKHKMEAITMKQYLAESKLPESALQPLYREDSDITRNNTSMHCDDDQAWRAEFGAIYQEHF